MQSCRASIVLFDRYDGIVALGDGRCNARDVAPGESTLIDASFVRPRHATRGALEVSH